ncbi:universal stress protein [Lacinutrix neustonica]|uniref:Universal stress protein n=1 Tax=Lacinutrix neustonica TaxID=2980107 RepID=A0A9E8SCN3_9FLAO|nr:universal stress protein [Lacinutrix neustonica]WAC00887.1 universal stress protein [Lacinutrix neustonica]
MTHNKYKILVLSDLKKSAELELKSTVGLAKMIDSEITLLHVQKPTEIVERESQLSAMRAINEEHIMTNKRILNLIQPISEAFQVRIHHELAIGNIKNEIEAFIIKYKPRHCSFRKKKI